MNDSLNGGNGQDALDDAAGDDVLTLGHSHDRACGGAGNDILPIYNIDTAVRVGGTDLITTGAGADGVRS